MAQPSSTQPPAAQPDPSIATVHELPAPRHTTRTGDRAIFQALDRNAPFPYARSDYRKRLIWLLVEKTIFRFSSPRANAFRAGLLRRFGAKLAPNVVIRPSATIRHPWLLEMGEFACIGENVQVYNLGPLAIGAHSTVSQNCHLCAGTHDYKDPAMPLIRASIRIGRGCWVCADAFIGPDVCIGDNTIVGARAVVMKSIGPDVIVAGNPARTVCPRPMDEPQSV